MSKIKELILDLVIADLERQIATTCQGMNDAIAESKAHKGAMESRYDTFKEEAQYLAGAHNTRMQTLHNALATLKFLKTVCPATTKAGGYAIVEVEDLDDGVHTKYFLLPVGGGGAYDVGGEKLTTLSVNAPLGRALVGKVVDDEVEINIQGMVRNLVVVSIT